MGKKLLLQLEHRTATVQQGDATASWELRSSSFPSTHLRELETEARDAIRQSICTAIVPSSS